MKFFLTTTLLAVGALAQWDGYDPCPNQIKNHALCCNAGLKNILNFDCHTPLPYPTMDGEEFKATCASSGAYPKCCTIKLLDQGILCEDPSGIEDPNVDTYNPEGGDEIKMLLGDVGNILNEVVDSVSDLLATLNL